MRVAFILDSFPKLSETFILSQITGLIDLEAEVRIFARHGSREPTVHPDVEGYGLLNKTRHVKCPEKFQYRLVKSLWLLAKNISLRSLSVFLRSLRGNWIEGFELRPLEPFYYGLTFQENDEYDVFQCHFGPNGLLAAALRDKGLIKGRIVTAFHAYDLTAFLKDRPAGIYKLLFETGDLFLPISKTWENRLISLGCPKDKIIVHHMGIDVERFQFQPRAHDQKRVKVLSIGRLVEKKGFEYGIKAVSKNLRGHPELEYIIVGGGPLNQELRDLIKKQDVQDRIKLLGWKNQKEVIELIREAHILLAPSVTSSDGDMEGIPMVLMEAMATGMPIISTLHSGIPELVEDGVTGFLVPERDVDALAKRLEWLINHPEKWPEMGRKGREKVEKEFNIEKLNNQLFELYQRIMI